MGKMKALWQERLEILEEYKNLKELKMSDYVIDNDYRLDNYCLAIANDIIDELGSNWDLDEAFDLAFESAFADQHVVYHYKALNIVRDCSTDQGLDAVNDLGITTSDIFQLASWLVGYEMDQRIKQALVALDLEREDNEEPMNPPYHPCDYYEDKE